MQIENVAVTARVYPNGPTAARLRYGDGVKTSIPSG